MLAAIAAGVVNAAEPNGALELSPCNLPDLAQPARCGVLEVLDLLIPLGLVLMALAVAALFWAVDSGQYDDLDAPARAVLDAESAASDPEELSTPRRGPP